jgi:hypothetical protein
MKQRNWSQPNLRKYPGVSVEHLSKVTKHSTKINRIQAEIIILKLHIPLSILNVIDAMK